MYSLYDVVSVWNDFFFKPEYAVNLALFRIAIGLIVFVKSAVLIKNCEIYLGPNGWYAHKYWIHSHEYKHHFCLLKFLQPTVGSVYFLLYLTMVSSFCLTVGFCSLLSAIVTYIGFVSISHRNSYIHNSGDSLTRILLFLLVFSGCGTSLSVDNYLFGMDQLHNKINPWIVRLMQICVVNLYLQSCYYKINAANDWRSGWGLFYSLSNKSFNRFPFKKVPSKLKMITANWVMFFSQLCFPVGLWFKETRVVSWAALFVIHVMCQINLRIGFFGPVMLASLMLFVDSESLIKWFESIISG